MISRRHRLSKEQFNAVFKNGVVLHSALFTVRAVFEGAPPKAAIVVSKKVAASAVTRNTLRRKMFASIAACFHEKKINTGAYIFFLRTKTLPPHTQRVAAIMQSISPRTQI